MELRPQFIAQSPPAADPVARAKAEREQLARILVNPVPQGESRDIAGRHCRVFLTYPTGATPSSSRARSAAAGRSTPPNGSTAC
jgi:hypothetical protein